MKPFIIGAFLGTKKPEKITEYLAEFINEYKNLKISGLEINGKVRNLEILFATLQQKHL